MVTLNPTTEEAGASSPVTYTLPCAFELCEGVEFDDPQPRPIKLSASSNTNPKDFFMAELQCESLFVKRCPRGAAICFTAMETRLGGECRVTFETLPGPRSRAGRAIWLDATDLQAYRQARKTFGHVLFSRETKANQDLLSPRIYTNLESKTN
jgi:hypothetical protein